ncbi:anti-sigma factor family protein [Actinomadura chibensis]|uniref:Zf-HC2 domain-containing protein n=1 Tax=Actinomadura chibensis TaxID=392828 RepID=A0A5D0NM25_9ACTN|nr:zf-HC2 domain-containing protein [Actinomadura chibensis]TYB45570.1 zf-HC2 domain-containing protein [Actinomadura chibensis]
MTAGVEHSDVGAYALGLLSPADAKTFEGHLAACERCAAELPGLRGAGDLLTGLGPVRDDAPTDPGRQRRGLGRGARRTRLLLAAAAVLLFAGGVAVGTTQRHGSVPADLRGWGEIRSADDAKSGLAAVVAMQEKGWGTHVALDLGNLTGPRTCRLIAVSTEGEEREVTGWVVPATGYGAIGSPDHLQVHGGTAIPLGDIARFVVRADGARDLLSIPV